MILIVEGMAMCLIILMVCVIGIATDGPVGLVNFYEEDVRQRVVKLGLTTPEKIKRRAMISGIAVFIPMLVLIPYMVYGLNRAAGFRQGFAQMLVIGMIYGLFDRFFIDWYWVERTNAWNIPGTEDLKPYIPAKTKIMKWTATLVGYPLLFALIAWVMTIFGK